ncbi:hypothetical protein M4V62_39740 [Streptomyces durmitorensis]|uniref:Receptor ligand binding region domain-containing protein n=1 Tax=Streptomyces durmitorensis TaxID=319947 RepID=A0ABY4Q4Y8_9ACTN|nr:hypothetical protein [Streptomyces durmitorensis]UQT60719.1 hypothetical protein M4V62_39740 [Streptomyces durmitorensis]
MLLNTGDESFSDELLDKFAFVLGPQEQEKLVPYARLRRPDAPAPDQPQQRFLTLQAGEGLHGASPPKVGELRLRTFQLMKDLVQRAQSEPDALDEKALRDHIYTLRSASGLLGALTRVSCAESAPVAGWVDKFWPAVGEPLFHTFPRWCWAAWWSRRLIRSKRSWFVSWRGIDPSGRFFERMSNLLTLRGGGPEGQLETREELLFRALLADLDRARPGWFGAWARRRRARRVVLFGLPQAGTPEALLTRRFLSTYLKVADEAGSASLLLVGVGQAAAYAQEGWPTCRNLNEAADKLVPAAAGKGAPPPLLVSAQQPTFADGEADQGERLHPAPVKKFRWGPRTELTGELAIGSVILALLSTAVYCSVAPAAPQHCLDGEIVQGRAAPGVAPGATDEGTTPQEQYEEVLGAIKELNAKALTAEKKFHKPVRRVVYLGAGVDPDPDEVVMNGMIPELRGILLAQEELNRLASQDEDRVRLYVEVRDTGRKFKHVVRHARDVVRDAEANKERQDSRTVIGVIGFRESRQLTKEAARILSNGKVPVIGTTATAVAMQQAGEYYRPMSPDNSRETAIAARFARHGNIIETEPGRCESSTRALVVKDPNDLYTRELGGKFVQKFGAGTETWEFPGGRGTDVSAQDTAQHVCDVVKEDRRTVVYWASRVESFTKFVNAYGPDGGCAGIPLTVIGSNELTNAALGGQYLDKEWLRLYHTVHVLPDGHADGNGQAKEFITRYIRRYTDRDPWINDGHVALAHDALKVLSSAADREYTSVDSVDAEGVKSKLDEGIRFEGVSGEIRIPERRGSKPPLNKALVMLNHTAQGQRLVLHCGAFKQNDGGPVDRWGPDGKYKCPQDKK